MPIFLSELRTFVAVAYALRADALVGCLAAVIFSDADAFALVAGLIFRASMSARAAIVSIEIQVRAGTAAVGVACLAACRRAVPRAIRRSTRAGALRGCDRSAGLLERNGPINVGAFI
jgi:hypothetical protein